MKLIKNMLKEFIETTDLCKSLAMCELSNADISDKLFGVIPKVYPSWYLTWKFSYRTKLKELDSNIKNLKNNIAYLESLLKLISTSKEENYKHLLIEDLKENTPEEIAKKLEKTIKDLKEILEMIKSSYEIFKKINNSGTILSLSWIREVFGGLCASYDTIKLKIKNM